MINASSAKWDSDYCTQLEVTKGAYQSVSIFAVCDQRLISFNNFTIFSKKATQGIIPRLKTAENGGKAPVEEYENKYPCVGDWHSAQREYSCPGGSAKGLDWTFQVISDLYSRPLLYTTVTSHQNFLYCSCMISSSSSFEFNRLFSL